MYLFLQPREVSPVTMKEEHEEQQVQYVEDAKRDKSISCTSLQAVSWSNLYFYTKKNVWTIRVYTDAFLMR